MTTQSTEPTPRRAQKPIVIALAVAGGLVLVGLGATAVLATVGDRGPAVSSGSTVVTDGLSSIEVDAGQGDFVLEFADVDEARLDIVGDARWTMERDGDELVIASRGGLFGGVLDLCFGSCGERGATLTLPASLNGIDADLSLGAGSLTASGEFGEIELGVGAGRAIVTGSAATFDAEISAGRMEADLVNVREVSIKVSAGRGDVRLGGNAPTEVEAKVSAGSLEMALPDVTYAVTSDVSAGSLDNLLRTDPSAPNRVTGEVSAGSLRLQPAK